MISAHWTPFHNSACSRCACTKNGAERVMFFINSTAVNNTPKPHCGCKTVYAYYLYYRRVRTDNNAVGRQLQLANPLFVVDINQPPLSLYKPNPRVFKSPICTSYPLHNRSSRRLRFSIDRWSLPYIICTNLQSHTNVAGVTPTHRFFRRINIILYRYRRTPKHITTGLPS